MLEIMKAYQCNECAGIFDEPGGTLYECQDCDCRFTKENSADGESHRCPDCNQRK